MVIHSAESVSVMLLLTQKKPSWWLQRTMLLFIDLLFPEFHPSLQPPKTPVSFRTQKSCRCLKRRHHRDRQKRLEVMIWERFTRGLRGQFVFVPTREVQWYVIMPADNLSLPLS